MNQGKIFHIVLRYLFIISISLTFFSCINNSEPAKPDEKEDRGEPIITYFWYDADMLWSPDGNEIFYNVEGMVKSIDPITRKINVIDSRWPGRLGIVSLLNFSADSNSLYYISLANSEQNYALYKASISLHTYSLVYESLPLSLLKSGISTRPQLSEPILIYSSDVLLLGNDSLFILDFNTKTISRFNTVTPLYLSNDQSVFAFSDEKSGELFETSLISKDSIRSLSVNYFEGHTPPWYISFKLTPRGFEGVFANGKYISIKNFTTNVQKDLWNEIDGYTSFYYKNSYWSPDGSRFAFVAEKFNYGTRRYDARIYEYIIDSGVKNQIAFFKDVDATGEIAFSPDNSKIVYSVNKELYYKKIH